MAGTDNFTIPQTFQEAWRRQDKRLLRQERRIPGASGAIVTGEGLPERVFEGAQGPEPSSAFLVEATGWQIDAQTGIAYPQSFGALVQWNATFRRIGAPIVSGAGGNITNSLVANLTDGWVPVVTQSGNTVGAGRLAAFAIQADGALYLTAIEGGGGDLATDEQVSCGGFYIAVNAEE